MKSLCVIALCFVFSQVESQQILTGKCENYNVKVTQDFNAEKYLGIWYETSRYEAIFQFNMDCVRANYSLLPNSKIRVINTGIILHNNGANRIEGVAYFAKPTKNEGKLVVKFPVSPEAKYWVIGTDYDNFAVVWSCTNLFPSVISVNMQFLWILSRTPKLSEENTTKIKNILKDANIDAAWLRTTNQDKCPWSNQI